MANLNLRAVLDFFDRGKAAREQTDRSYRRLAGNIGKYFTDALAVLGGIGIARRIGRLASTALQATKAQEAAEAQLAARIRATGGAAGYTADQLVAQAAALQKLTARGDEAIIGAQDLLLSFRRIDGSVFEAATEAVLDLARGTGQDLRSAAIQLGKALDDPKRGLDALSRSGTTFSDTQRALIRQLADTNRLAEAQGVILAEVAKQAGGLERAYRATLQGALDALGHALGDLLEGRNSLPLVREEVEKVIDVVEGLSFSGEVDFALSATAKAVRVLASNLGTLVAVGQALGVVVVARMVSAFVRFATGAAAAIAAATAFSGALAGASAATKALGVAVIGLRAGLAILGGPVGLIVTAAALLLYYGQRADDAATATDQLREARVRLGEIEAALAVEGNSRADALRTEREEIERLIPRLEGLIDTEARLARAMSVTREERLRHQIHTAEAEIDRLSKHPWFRGGANTQELDRRRELIRGWREELASIGSPTDPLAALMERFAPTPTPTPTPPPPEQGGAGVRIDTMAVQAAVEAERQRGGSLAYRDAILRRYEEEQEAAERLRREIEERADAERRYAAGLTESTAQAAYQLRIAERTVYERELLTAAEQAGIRQRISAGETLAAWFSRLTDAERARVAVIEEQLDLRREEIELLQRAEHLRLSESPLDGIREGLTRVTESVESGGARWADIVQYSAQRMEHTLTQFITTGRANWRGLIDSMIQEAARLAVVQPLIRGLTGAFAAWLGPARGIDFNAHPLYAHAGGIVGEGALRWPRYHRGGLASDEVPAILQRREGVFTAEQMRALAPVGSAAPQVTVEVINQAQPLRVERTEQRIEAGRAVISVVVADVRRRGDLAQTMEAHYGLRPVVT